MIYNIKTDFWVTIQKYYMCIENQDNAVKMSWFVFLDVPVMGL